MRRAAVLFVAALTLSLSGALAAPQEKWARGKVTAISAAAVTVDVNGKPMTFAVDEKTRVMARGATTKIKEAERTGGKPTISTFVKVGDNVEVSYEESGATMTAKEVRVGVVSPAGTSSDPKKTQTLTGVVSGVSGASLTVTPPKGDAVTFAVDPNTPVTGTGLGTLAKEKKAAGAKLTLTDAVGAGDTVEVIYSTSGEAKQATAVRVIRKKT